MGRRCGGSEWTARAYGPEAERKVVVREVEGQYEVKSVWTRSVEAGGDAALAVGLTDSFGSAAPLSSILRLPSLLVRCGLGCIAQFASPPDASDGVATTHTA
jgi:hypothetical protein